MAVAGTDYEALSEIAAAFDLQLVVIRTRPKNWTGPRWFRGWNA